jgi:hypothetical protein
VVVLIEELRGGGRSVLCLLREATLCGKVIVVLRIQPALATGFFLFSSVTVTHCSSKDILELCKLISDIGEFGIAV